MLMGNRKSIPDIHRTRLQTVLKHVQQDVEPDSLVDELMALMDNSPNRNSISMDTIFDMYSEKFSEKAIKDMPQEWFEDIEPSQEAVQTKMKEIYMQKTAQLRVD